MPKQEENKPKIKALTKDEIDRLIQQQLEIGATGPAFNAFIATTTGSTISIQVVQPKVIAEKIEKIEKDLKKL